MAQQGLVRSCCRGIAPAAARPAAIARALGLRCRARLHASSSSSNSLVGSAVDTPQQQQQHAEGGAAQRTGGVHTANSSIHLGGASDNTSSTISSSSMQHAAQISLGLAVALLAIGVTSTPPAAAAAADGLQHHSSSSIQPMFDLAEDEEFWGNVVRYARYFVTVMLGTGYVMVQPLVAAFKRPVTAIVAVVGIGGGFVLLKFVLNAMLGIQEPFDYVPGQAVPYS